MEYANLKLSRQIGVDDRNLGVVRVWIVLILNQVNISIDIEGKEIQA